MNDQARRQVEARQRLYDEVWARPMVKVAKEYGVSDVAVKKWCKKLNIPTPGLGYWAKAQHGKKVKQTPLPSMSEETLRRLGCIVPLSKPEVQSTSGRLLEEDPAIAFEREPKNQIVVPPTLDGIHPLVMQVKELAETINPGENGIANVSGPGLVSVRVAPNNLMRAYRILTAVLNAAYDRGYGLSIGIDERRGVYLTVNGERMSIEIGETVDRSERPLTEEQEREKERSPWLYRRPNYDYIPSGRINISVLTPYGLRCRTTWSDSKRKRLEESLNSFMISLIKASREVKEIREARERQQREWAEHLRQQEIAKKRSEFRRKREEDFAKSVDRWHAAERMRQYLEAVIERAKAEHFEEDPGFAGWFRWASAQVSMLDPLMNGAASDVLRPAMLLPRYHWKR